MELSRRAPFASVATRAGVPIAVRGEASAPAPRAAMISMSRRVDASMLVANRDDCAVSSGFEGGRAGGRGVTPSERTGRVQMRSLPHRDYVENFADDRVGRGPGNLPVLLAGCAGGL